MIGEHLATLNLFREADGTIEITVADARGAIQEMTGKNYGLPVHYVEGLIIEAADRIKARHLGG